MTVNVNPIKRAEYIKGIIKCNDTIMEYFRQDIQKRKNSYKPKLKDTLEHRKAIHNILKDILEEELLILNVRESS